MSSVLHPFSNCWDRIDRAKAHYKAFGDAWSRFTDDDPYEIRVSMNDDGTGSIWIERTFATLPAALALELGEQLYHLRSTLDACIYEAAILESGQDPPSDEQALEFPICSTAIQFRNSRRKIRPITDQNRLTIIESVQPYNAPELPDELMVYNINRSFAILNDWARKDRHRKLHLIGSWASRANPQFRLPEGTFLEHVLVTRDGFLEHESEIASFKIGNWERGMEIEANPDFYIDIAVDEMPPPIHDADRLGNRLRAMGIGVQSVVREFEKSFGLSPNTPVF